MIFLGIALFFGVLYFAITRRPILSVVIFLVNLFLSWVGMPTLNYGFPGIIVLGALNGALISVGAYRYAGDFEFEVNKKSVMWCGIGIFGVFFLFGLFIIPILTSWSLFHADAYRNLIGPVSQGTFSTDTSPVDITQVRNVDQELAARLADKRLGEDTALGSQVEVGTMNIQQIKGRLFWVGPLNHSGFFRWWSNSQGTPGYVMVSATDDRDVRLVRKLGEKNINLKYNMGNFWNDNIKRYLYNNGFSTVGLTDYTFEIDNEGNPFWVVTIFEKKIGYNGNDAVGVVLLNAQTGEIKKYSIDEAPKWVDRIQPEKLVTNQLNDWGYYIHGWLNPSNKDRLKVTPGMSLVYGKDGNSYWYTGMTSVGADEGTVGFVLINTRTKEARLYKQAGATETAAMSSAQGAVQEKQYVATFPILYNVSSLPTYFMTLKDNAGLVKRMAFVSVENYSVFGIGQTVREALREYRKAMMSRGNAIAPDSIVSRHKVIAEVLRIAIEPGSRGATFYLLLRGHEQKLFVGSSELSPEILITQKGDPVQISFDEGGGQLVDMASFDNLNLQLQKTAAQQAAEDRTHEARKRQRDRQAGQNAEAEWENLTPAQKSELMKQNKN